MQANKVCSICSSVGHSKFYCKVRVEKPIARSSIKKKVNVAKVKVLVKKRISRGQWVKRLDSVFSQYIRLRDDGNGCITCGDVKHWKELQNCHFFTRGRFATRWDEMNCHSGCVKCNVFLKGNYINYTRYMIDRFGRQAVDELEIKSLSTVKIPTHAIEQMIEEYKLRVKELLNETR